MIQASGLPLSLDRPTSIDTSVSILVGQTQPQTESVEWFVIQASGLPLCGEQHMGACLLASPSLTINIPAAAAAAAASSLHQPTRFSITVSVNRCWQDKLRCHPPCLTSQINRFICSDLALEVSGGLTVMQLQRLRWLWCFTPGLLPCTAAAASASPHHSLQYVLPPDSKHSCSLPLHGARSGSGRHLCLELHCVPILWVNAIPIASLSCQYCGGCV